MKGGGNEGGGDEGGGRRRGGGNSSVGKHAQATKTAAAAAAAGKDGGGNADMGFVMLQAVEHLKNAGQPVSTKELQQVLKLPNGANVLKFLYALKEHPQIEFSKENKTWFYLRPYAHLKTEEMLLDEISHSKHKMTGFLITSEFLEGDDMPHLLNKILAERKVRALRIGKSVRCKNFDTDSPITCPVYAVSTDKCDNCASLAGISLYPLDRGEVEAMRELVSEDIKELWMNVALPTIENFIEELRLDKKNKTPVTHLSRRKRRAMGDPDKLKNFRANKIVNLHIYTAEEYKQELLNLTD